MTSDDIPDINKIRQILKELPNRFKQELVGCFITFTAPLTLKTAEGLEIYDKVDEADHWIWYTGTRPFNSAHLAVVILVLATVLATLQNRLLLQENQTEDFLIGPITAKAAAEFTNRINKYTPAFQEDPTQVALSKMLAENDDFYSQPIIPKTKTSDNKTVRTEGEVKYVVQEGDTLSSIGWKYGLKIASIKYANNLESEVIRPGQILTLPAQDIDPAIIERAARIKAEKARRQRELARRRRLAAASRYRSTTYRARSYTPSAGFIVPVHHRGISQGITPWHPGIDYMADVGTPVVAAAAGRVVVASYGWNGGYGNQVVIDHGGRRTRYAHLRNLTVSVGQFVEQGQIIGYVGLSGRTTGPHLHYEPYAR